MKKLVIYLIVVLAVIVLLFQLTSVQADSFNGITADDDPNIPAEINESIAFFDSNDIVDANDPNLPESAE